jgi:O-antigen/teichoic acid export membrane protein
MKRLIIVSARGFGHALIRKKVATNTDFSTIFFFNIFVGIILFVLLFSLAPSIARLYNEPALHAIKRVMAFTLIINSLGLIQRTNLPKSVNFKLQTKITFIS